MKAGELRHRITFIRSEMVSRDAAGGIVRGDKVHARTWAKVVQLSGTELVQAQQKKPNSTHMVTTRFLANITPEIRIQHNGRTLHIENINNVGDRNIELNILCREEG